LLALACAHDGPHGDGGRFSIAVLPDTQNAIDYTHQEAAGFPFDASALFLAQMDWIAGRAVSQGGDVAFVASVGDVWQHQTLAMDPGHAARGFERIPNRWFESELEATPQTRVVELPMAREGYRNLVAAGIPFGVAPGNHDYDAMWSDARFPPVDDVKQIDMTPKTLGLLHVGGLDNFRSVFGAESEFFAGKPWYVAHRAGGASSAQTFTAGGYTFLHLALEMAPGDAVLAWAREVIAAHPGLPTIVTTHDYLDPQGRRRASPIIDLPSVDPEDGSAEKMWEELIAPSAQIFLVLCGHHHGVATRIDRNEADQEVVQLLADYQSRGQTSLEADVPRHPLLGRPEGIGDGWLRLLTFDTTEETPLLRVRTFSPHYDAWAEELETYATWYKPDERPDLDDAAFVAKDAFTLPLTGFRERFGPPR
jgi:hypothetical protein